MTALARTLCDRKNINHRRNIQVFSAPEDLFGLDEIERLAMPWLAGLLEVVRGRQRLDGNLFYENLDDAIGGRPAYSLKWKRENLLQVARQACNVLEIGFNAGHAALLFLLANPLSRVTCIDRMDHPYTQDCFDYLAAAFPGRLRLIAGDSLDVLPTLRGEYFDLVHLDAGKHRTIEADLTAIRGIVHADHVIAIDDTQNKALDDIVIGRRRMESWKLLPSQPPTHVRSVRVGLIRLRVLHLPPV